MSEKEIDYYYTMSSPWTYLGHDLFLAMAAQAGARVNHKPVDLGAVFEVSGGLPLGKRPAQRQHYRLFELQRWRAYRKVPLNLHPRFFPVDATMANKMVLAAQRAGQDAGRLAGACMRAVWVDERNIADPDTLKAIAGENGMDGASLLHAASEPAAAAEYADLTEEAKRREVFGAPTYHYRGEPFWGQDRLDFVERALKGETEPVRIA